MGFLSKKKDDGGESDRSALFSRKKKGTLSHQEWCNPPNEHITDNSLFQTPQLLRTHTQLLQRTTLMPHLQHTPVATPRFVRKRVPLSQVRGSHMVHAQEATGPRVGVMALSPVMAMTDMLAERLLKLSDLADMEG
jgi:hypothetical protein